MLVHGENGEISGITGVATDITKQKQAESMIQQQNEELGASNEEFEAMNEELVRSQQELLNNEKALRERDREMRAVLNATIDMVMLLDSSGLILIYNNSSSQQFSESEKPQAGMNYFDYLARHGMTGRLELIKGVAESGRESASRIKMTNAPSTSASIP